MAERLVASGVRMRIRADVPEGGVAGLGARAVAFVMDSIVLFAFTMLFLTLAGLVIFISSDFGEENPSDSAFTGLVLVLLATIPSWLLLNFLLVLKRGQTLGHYVMGLRVLTEESTPPNARRVLASWLMLHPLLFHPIFSGLWVLVGFYLIDGGLLLLCCLALALLSLLAPVAALLFALIDPEHRALHDRLAGTKVVRLD
jgi:uncharacterized RDD family membrane protein YckC